jgi:hypothetical protein
MACLRLRLLRVESSKLKFSASCQQQVRAR